MLCLGLMTTGGSPSGRMCVAVVEPMPPSVTFATPGVSSSKAAKPSSKGVVTGVNERGTTAAGSAAVPVALSVVTCRSMGPACRYDPKVPGRHWTVSGTAASVHPSAAVFVSGSVQALLF